MRTKDVRSTSAVKATDKAFRIVETLQELDGGRVSEVAEELDMAESTVHRHLKSLNENEYVTKEGDLYHVGFRFLDLGDYVRNRNELYRLAEPKVESVANETNERAEFIVEEFGRAVFVHRHIGSSAIQADSHLGKRLPMHATSAGKAILAYLPDDRVDEILERTGMRSYTSQTITDKKDLLEELEAVQENGVAFNQEEYIAGMNTVSVPVMNELEQIGGALGVSGPAHRLKDDRLESEIPDLLLGIANELEINLSYR